MTVDAKRASRKNRRTEQQQHMEQKYEHREFGGDI